MNKYTKNLNRIEFVITNSCTGKCKHCSQGEHVSNEHIDTESAVQAVYNICKNYKIESLMTFGGEPLLYPETVCEIHSAIDKHTFIDKTKTTYYNTKDGIILSQTDGTDTFYFQYDTNGAPLGFIWNGTQYLYMTNQMGDVISITDEQGNELVQYEYDAWGKCVSTVTTHKNDIEIKLSNINPIRYRGYYLDNETGYYYLQSRYYDPDICRFINEDILIYAILHKNDSSGLSVFVYSYNNPTNRDDKNGFSSAGLAGSAFFYYFVTYVLPKIAGAVCYGVLFLSGVLFVY